MSSKFRGKDILLATHGFNVTGQERINALGWLDQRLQARNNEFFFGVLWPGDWWIPAINYSAEASGVVQAGKYLADLCNDRFKQRAVSPSCRILWVGDSSWWRSSG